MKIRRSPDFIHIDLTGPEAVVLLEELENVRGGAKMPKLRQVCDGLRASIGLTTSPPPPKRGRPPTKLKLIPQVEAMRGPYALDDES